jgi:hypothetical protein
LTTRKLAFTTYELKASATRHHADVAVAEQQIVELIAGHFMSERP